MSVSCPVCGKVCANNGALSAHRKTHKDEEPEPTANNIEPFAMLGDDPVLDQPHKTWQIPIDDFVGVNPKDYFVTTGEAVTKTDQLLKDLAALQKDVRRFKQKLLKARAESKYLETCWVNGRLIIKRKDPRRKTPPMAKEAKEAKK